MKRKEARKQGAATMAKRPMADDEFVAMHEILKRVGNAVDGGRTTSYAVWVLAKVWLACFSECSISLDCLCQ